MPKYEFECEHCQKPRDVVLTVRDRNAAVPCPDCGTVMVRKLSAPNFVVEGFAAVNGYSKTV